MSEQKLNQDTMRATLETAKALVAALTGQAALECFVPQFIRAAGGEPHPAHVAAATRIAEKMAVAFRDAMKDEAPAIRDQLGAELGIKP